MTRCPSWTSTSLPLNPPCSDRFNRWIAEKRPEAIEATAFGNWTTVEEARQTGELRAQFAQEWADYLQENNCGYVDGC